MKFGWKTLLIFLNPVGEGGVIQARGEVGLPCSLSPSTSPSFPLHHVSSFVSGHQTSCRSFFGSYFILDFSFLLLELPEPDLLLLSSPNLWPANQLQCSQFFFGLWRHLLCKRKVVMIACFYSKVGGIMWKRLGITKTCTCKQLYAGKTSSRPPPPPPPCPAPSPRPTQIHCPPPRHANRVCLVYGGTH